MLGRFHEIGIRTADIRASVDFYERLGFAQAQTTDTWSHPYGVLTDGRLFLGLHQSSFDSPTLTFVHEGVARHARELESRGVVLAYQRTAEHEFNSVGLKDPNGQMLVLIEARTYSPVLRRPQRVSQCGYFEEFSMPSTQFAPAKAFWEEAGFVATEAAELPYPHLALTSDHLDIAFHAPRIFDRPMLVFRDQGMRARLAMLRAIGIGTWRAPPQSLDAHSNALLEAPEGTPLLFLEEAS
ncbi:MAG TPA: VOC family protein [Steroidobacteraceae bacterium]|nr:VOC family protein [Steroidobacteraceae bacterium]